jgi:hypothetical protein
MTKGLSSSVRGYFDRTNVHDGITKGDLDKYNRELELFRNELISRTKSIRGTPFDNILLTEITRRLTDHSRFVTSSLFNEVNNELSELVTKTSGRNEALLSLLYVAYNQYLDYMKSLPSIQSLQTLLLQFEKTLPNKNPELSNQILANILQLFPFANILYNVQQNYQRAKSKVVNTLEELENDERAFRHGLPSGLEEVKEETRLQEEKEGEPTNLFQKTLLIKYKYYIDTLLQTSRERNDVKEFIDNVPNMLRQRNYENVPITEVEKDIEKDFSAMIFDRFPDDMVLIIDPTDRIKRFLPNTYYPKQPSSSPPPPKSSADQQKKIPPLPPVIPLSTKEYNKIKIQLQKNKPNKTEEEIYKIMEEL